MSIQLFTNKQGIWVWFLISGLKNIFYDIMLTLNTIYWIIQGKFVCLCYKNINITNQELKIDYCTVLQILLCKMAKSAHVICA